MLKFKLPDMTCGHCEAVVTKAVHALDAGAKFTIDLPAQILTIESAASAAELSDALRDAGYPAHPV